MNSTSRSSRLVSSAARSPALAITGPEVARKLTPSSRATICASVVLPRPGGPTNSTWSSASLRARAASMKTVRFARACSWPTNSASVCGRSEASAASSSRRSGDDAACGPWAAHHRARPRTYLFGSSSAMVATVGSSPFGTITRALRVVVVDDLAARAARRDHRDGAVRLAGLGMAHRDDRLDALVARLGDGAADRHRLGAHRHAAEIGVDVDAGDDAPVARAQRRADLLPLVAIARPDRLARGGDQLAVLLAQRRAAHRASSFSASADQPRRLGALAGRCVAAAIAAAACGWP